MAPAGSRKRKVDDGVRAKAPRPRKRVRKQLEYHSSSESDDAENEGADFMAVNLTDSEPESLDQASNGVKNQNISTNSPSESQSEVDSEDESEDESLNDELEDDADENNTEGGTQKRVTKRNDPSAFATSISKILSTKLPQSARKDPLLSRSKEAADASSELANEKLEKRARDKIRADKKAEKEVGRVKDVLGLDSGRAGEVADEEKRLRKIAQRGVVKLFNAVRAAQVKSEEAMKEERKKGTLGLDHRMEKVNEVSKENFLQLINGKGRTKPVEEAR
ncbi:MAG: hypothetical protein Q9227_001442 [Pyrenula ochraceoflavens]